MNRGPKQTDGVRTEQTSLEEEIGMLIGRCGRMVWGGVASSLERRGESLAVWGVLATLVRSGPCTQAELAAHLAQHPTVISRWLDLMQSHRLVRRTRAVDDRRKVRVECTLTGRRLFSGLKEDARRSIERALQPLAASERTQLRALLEKIADVEDQLAVRTRRS